MKRSHASMIAATLVVAFGCGSRSGVVGGGGAPDLATSGGGGDTGGGGVDGGEPGASDGGVVAGDCHARDFSSATAALAGEVPKPVQGISFGVYAPGCAPLFAGTAGNLMTDSVVPLASATKMPSVTAIMTLVDAGKLALDTPVGTYLAGWPAGKAAVTLRMLLSHTSGLPGMVACLGDTATTLTACAHKIAATPLQATPGTTFIYGGADFQVAGRVAEVVAGEPWAQLFDEAVAQPCGLMTFTWGATQNPRIAGGASSNNADYGKLLALHLAGGRCGDVQVLSPAAVAEMQKDEIGSAIKIGSSPYPDGRHCGRRRRSVT